MFKPSSRKLNVKIFTINEKLDNVQDNLIKCKDAISTNNLEEFDRNLKEGFDNAQRAYIDIRKFASECTSSKSEIKKLNSRETEGFDVSISILDNNIIKYSMPIIIPFCHLKRYKYFPKQATDEQIFDAVFKTDAILNSIYNATEEFKKNNNIDVNLYKNVTILFVNNFDKKYKQCHIPDSDNYSYKHIADIITNAFCYSFDDFHSCDFVYSSRINNFTGTEVYLIPNCRLGQAVVSLIENNAANELFSGIDETESEQQKAA